MRKLFAIALGILLLLSMAVPAAAAGTAESTLPVWVGDAAGLPIDGAAVEVYGLNQGLILQRMTGPDGTARLPYQPGQRNLWLVRASANGYGVEETGWFDPAYGGMRRISLEPLTGDLQLLFRSESGERLDVDLVLLAPDGRVVAQERAAAGRFARTGLPAGEYRLAASATGYAPLERSLPIAAGRLNLQTVTMTEGGISATGQVVDAVTLSPLDGARVELLQGEAGTVVAEAKTGLTGRFTIKASASGSSYRLRVSAPGYGVMITPPQSVGSGRYLDYSGQNQVELAPATGSVAGVLTTPGGRPIPRAKVVLLREGFGEAGQAESDAQGEFRFEGVAAGYRYMVVAHEAMDPITVDWLHLVASDWLEVKPGVTVHTSVTSREWPLYSLSTGTVTGKVVTPTGKPVEGATVELIRYTRVVDTATTDAAGSFTFDSVDATTRDGFATPPYSIRISGEGFVPNRQVTAGGQERTTFEVPVGARVALEATLRPALVDLKGRVVDPSGKPVASARVALSLDDRAEAKVVTADGAGWYSLTGVPSQAAVAALRVTADGYLPAGGIEVTGALGGDSAPPVVELIPQRATLEGVVVDLDGRPVAGAAIAVTSGGAVVAEGVSDVDGYYNLEADLTNAELALVTAAKEGYASGGLVLPQVPGPGERAERMLLLQPQTATLEGRVVDAVGMPMAGVPVAVVVNGRGSAERTVSAADGRYRLEVNLSDGAAWAWLRAEPLVGRFGGSVTHGLSYAPLMRLAAGDHRVVDLLVSGVPGR